MEPYAFALPTMFDNTINPPNFGIDFLVIAVDGVNAGSLIDVVFTWDVTQQISTNISNLKAAIVSQCASQLDLTVLSSNVNILMAVS